MSIKIVAGERKGHKIRGPKSSAIRPAAAAVRKSLFDILGDLTGKRILDLFAGTGSVGLEALSRGASEAVFVDSGQEAISLLFKNLEVLNFLKRAHILKKPAIGAIEFLFRKKLEFDVIFLDPPYDRGWVDRCLKKLEKFPLLAPKGILVCEHSPREIPAFLTGLSKTDERKYGQTLVTFFQLKETHAK